MATVVATPATWLYAAAAAAAATAAAAAAATADADAAVDVGDVGVCGRAERK